MKRIIAKKPVNKKRAIRIRRKIMNVSGRPRLSVFRSNKYFYAQIIDDAKAVTLVSASEKDLDSKMKGNKTEKAQEIGKVLAQKALGKKIKEVVFDKGSYKYHGRVKAFADSAREGGLQF